MNKRRDDETEPMTRLLGTFVSEPRPNEPHRRLADVAAERTKLEIGRPSAPPSEPATQLTHRAQARPVYSFEAATIPGSPRSAVAPRPAETTLVPGQSALPATPQPAQATPQPPQPFEAQRDSPAGPIKPMFAPRLSQADQDEITTSRAAPYRKTPIVLAVALLLVCFATGASLLRSRLAKRRAPARPPSAAAVEPEPVRPEASSPPPASTTAPATPAAPVAPKTRPDVPTAPAPAAVAPAQRLAQQAVANAVDLEAASPDEGEASIDELERRAVDRLEANDHGAALAAYTELSRRQPKDEAYSVMVTLLSRRVRACQGDPSCAH